MSLKNNIRILTRLQFGVAGLSLVRNGISSEERKFQTHLSGISSETIALTTHLVKCLSRRKTTGEEMARDT
jgi:hypothetical protein